MIFNKIIVAYDDSQGSRNALEKGIQLSQLTPNTELLLAHVDEEKLEHAQVASPDSHLRANANMIEGMQLQPLSISDHEPPASSHSKVINSVDQAIQHAKQIVEKNHMEINYKILEGKPADSICQFADTEGADLIIVGSSGKQGIKRMFLGSTSEKITKNANCNVLIAK
ncbi:universal stress protein [Cytobacillus purgationiresistens]|uniref:Nucleotide-binding universal stress UspA family protein n=1 Tax=Cytobacillus purgationiresistens TaxID=863449 RepID=A0ABU0ACK5_9BACI|nr:universal stress protein [Cytobacillus purgationiresistens]MDQ0268982.1 nucleotide-binding universal stress UspA family protein [Cytobacillus purgationiresistens]